YGYDGLLMHPVDPPSLDYVHGLEEPEQASLSSDYVPGPEHPEYLAPYDEEVPIEDQPYAAGDSPMALSPGYIADTDLKEDSDNKSEDGPADYPADRWDDDEDDDDDDGDDVDDEDEEQAFDEEEEEYLAPTDSTTVASLVVDPVPSVEETDPFKTDESAATPLPPPAYRTTARMFIRAQTPIPFSSELEIPSPPLPVPSPLATSPTYNEAPLGFRAAKIRFEVGESSTAVAARQPGLRATRITDYGFVDMVDGAPRHHVPREIKYGITDTWDELVDVIQEGASTTLEGVNSRVTELAETHDRDTHDLYAHLKDAQDTRACLSGRVDILIEDRQFCQPTVMMIEDVTRVSQEAWAHAMGYSMVVHYELQSYRAHTHIQDFCISSQKALTATLVAQKMASRRGTRTRTTPTTATATTTTLMTDAAIRALIAQGVANALAGRPI
ncbi:hypothetical protein Tco_0318200, partial [Tanacetum coccineum]